MAKRISLLTLGTLCLGLLSGCQDEVKVTGGKPVVYVPVPPYKEIANRLAGDVFEIRSLVSESDDPHEYSPTPKQVAQLSQAAILFTGEMPFEDNLVEKIAAGNSKIKVFSITESINLLEGSCDHPSHHGSDDDDVYVYVKGQDATLDEDDHHHDHGDDDEVYVYVKGQDDEHDHAEHDHHHHEHELDPHLWLSPKILKIQATTMAGILKNNAPSDAEQIDQNLKAVLVDLDSLDTRLAEKLAFMKGHTFYVYHGAFAYFAEAYGLKQEAIEIGGRRPEPKRLTTLIEKAKADGVKLIFVQPQFDQSSARSLADAIGGQVLMLDPLEQDIFANLQNIATNIGQSALPIDQ